MKRAFTGSLLVLIALFAAFPQDDLDTPGFGNQSIRIDPSTNNNILIKKVLGSTPYRLTPGDTYELVVKLETTERITLILPPDYRLELPYLGTYDARDQYFTEFRARIIRDIKKRLPVAEYVDFLLTSPALFEVTVYGGVKTPGPVTVTSLTTVWEAVVAAGGPKAGGSIRTIRLFRSGTELTCDIASYTQKADFSQNPLLEPGDTIFVPHSKIVVQVEGAIVYPDAYEMLPGETLRDLLWMAGGFRPDAMKESIEIARIDDGKQQLIKVDAGDVALQNGDRINIPSVVEVQETVLVEAALYGSPAEPDEPRVIPQKPIALEIPFTPGLSVLDILDTFGGPTPLADAEQSVIYRGKEEIRFDAQRLWKSRDPSLDPSIEAGDHFLIPMKKLSVVVAGEVYNPGTYPYITGGLVSDYIGAAGGVIPERAGLNRIFLVDKTGEKELANLQSSVLPGTTIYVDKNTWKHTTYVIEETGIIIGFASSLITLLTAIMELIALF